MRTAYATLRRVGKSWLWVVDNCPHCDGHRTHTHGGGLVGKDDPDRFLGPRAGHGCGPYELARDPKGNHDDEGVTILGEPGKARHTRRMADHEAGGINHL